MADDDDLAAALSRLEREPPRYRIQGDAARGWWTGTVPHRAGERQQAFVALNRGVQFSQWSRLSRPGVVDPRSRPPAIYACLFNPGGDLVDTLTRADSLIGDPRRGGQQANFDVDELEATLRAWLGGFERGTIRVRPFAIADIDLTLSPLPSFYLTYLDDPDSFDEEERDAIRDWLASGNSELYFGSDHFLAADGQVKRR